MTVIDKGTLAKYRLHVLSGIGQRDCLFLSGIIKILRGLHFFDGVSSKMKIFQYRSSIGICRQVCFYQIPFTVDFRTVSSYNIRSRIDVINSALLPAVLIAEGYALFRHISSGQNLSFLVNGQLAKLFLIRHRDRGGLVCYQVHIIGRSIQAVSGRSRNLF